tara:strand:+ start:1009 stop:1722 length:714 start_codon:yes stop_codon:yes gene_type:complete
MSDSESEAETVEVETPPKKTKQPISEERRKQMLENLAKGRKKRAENLSNKRLAKEEDDVKKAKDNRCDYCDSEFKYKASKTKHMKTCKQNPSNVEVDDKPLEIEPKENVKVEKKENETIEAPKPKEALKKKKKVVYTELSESSSSESEEEIVIRRRKSSKRRPRRVVEAQRPAPAPIPRPAPIPKPAPVPQLTQSQKDLLNRRKDEQERLHFLARKQKSEEDRIKQLAANMVRKNRF